MWLIYILYFIFAFLISVVLCLVEEYLGLKNLYEKIQGGLFSSFLTMGSFTLSLTAFFLGSLKEKLFDSDKYIKKIQALTELQCGSSCRRYDQLINISKLFIFCIMMCFLTSLSQITLGLIKKTFFISICLAMAISTILLALYILYNVWKTIEIWLSMLNR